MFLKNYFCLIKGIQKLDSLINFTANRFYHQTIPLQVLDRSYKSKKYIIKSAGESKYEVPSSDPAIGIGGYTDQGIVIPTVDTPATLYNGIRYDELPIVHIHSSPNNTIMTATNFSGLEIIDRSSCGSEGFKNVKKSTTVAAQATGLALGIKLVKKGLNNIKVAVKGIGSGRFPSMKGLQMAGLTVVSITDRTHVQHIGPRPRKAKRL